MKILLAIALSIVLILLGMRIFSFIEEERQLSQTLSDTEARLQKAQTNEANLSAQLQYLQNPANFQKELRAQYNYKKSGETMMIIVPQQSSTASSSY
jgi:cell division protein FtsB